MEYHRDHSWEHSCKMNLSNTNCQERPDGITEFREVCFDLQIVYFISGWHFYSLAFIAAFDAVLVIPTTVLNLLVIIAIAKNRTLQTVSNLLLTCLAVCDLLTGMITQPLIASGTSFVLNCNSFCWLFVSAFQVGYFLATASFLTLTAVSLDRYIAIFHPFKYQHLTATKKYICGIATFTWLIPLLMVIVTSAMEYIRVQQFFLAILAPVSVTLSMIVQVKTVRAVNKARRRDLSLSIRPRDPTAGRTRRRTMNSGKASITALTILVATIICYLPQSALTIIRMMGEDKFAFQGIYDWTKTLILMSSTLNPVIYCLNLTGIRRKILQMTCPWIHQHQIDVFPISMTTVNNTSKRTIRKTTLGNVK